jgi:hypothetical protein
MSATTLKFKTYEILKNRFSEVEASTSIEYVEAEAEQSMMNKKEIFATREDVIRLESKFETKLSETKADLIKWMFLFWIGQTAAVLAIVKLL